MPLYFWPLLLWIPADSYCLLQRCHDRLPDKRHCRITSLTTPPFIKNMHPVFCDDAKCISIKLTVHSAHSNLVKMHSKSPSVMAFCPVYLGIVTCKQYSLYFISLKSAMNFLYIFLYLSAKNGYTDLENISDRRQLCFVYGEKCGKITT